MATWPRRRPLIAPPPCRSSYGVPSLAYTCTRRGDHTCLTLPSSLLQQKQELLFTHLGQPRLANNYTSPSFRIELRTGTNYPSSSFLRQSQELHLTLPAPLTTATRTYVYLSLSYDKTKNLTILLSLLR